MKYLLLLSLLLSCNSKQKVSNELQISQMMTQNDPEKYFLGEWFLTEKLYDDNGVVKNYTLHECMKKYSLNFLKNEEEIILFKNYATGKNCEIKSSSAKYIITFDGSSFSYTQRDLKKIEQYKIYSDKKFSIISKDIINGKLTRIENVYIKK